MNKELDEKLVNRLQKALESEQFELPKGLTREQKRKFILSKVSDDRIEQIIEDSRNAKS